MKNMAGIQVQRMGNVKVCTSWFMFVLVKSAAHAHNAAVAGTSFQRIVQCPLLLGQQQQQHTNYFILQPFSMLHTRPWSDASPPHTP